MVASPGFSCSSRAEPAVRAITVWRSTCSCPPNTVSALRPLDAALARLACSRAMASKENFCIRPSVPVSGRLRAPGNPAGAPLDRLPPASPVHLAGDRPGVRHRAHVPQLVGVAHRADRLNLPVEYVECQGKEHVVVPIAEDRSWLAIHLAWLERHVDTGEPGEHCGKHPGRL